MSYYSQRATRVELRQGESKQGCMFAPMCNLPLWPFIRALIREGACCTAYLLTALLELSRAALSVLVLPA